MVASEQILVVFIKCPLFLLGKVGTDSQLFYVLRGLHEIQLKAGEFVLKIHGWGVKMGAVKKFPGFFCLVIFLIFLCPSFLQRLDAGIFNESEPFCKKEGSLRLLPFFSIQTILLIHYFTAPAIPLAKLFCKHRKIIAVGRVQINTPSISIP